MKKITALLTLLIISLSAQAQTIYITDSATYTLRSIESNKGRILRMLPSGTALTVISVNKENGYSKVQTSDGTEGYVLSRFTLNQPINRWFLNKANKKIEILQQVVDQTEHELSQLKNITPKL